jgi:hypothetical protein
VEHVDGADDGVLVYLLAGSPRNDVAVFGKHHRALISPDGRTVMKLEPLSKGIIEIPLGGGVPEGCGESRRPTAACLARGI